MNNYGYIYKLTSPSCKSYIGQTHQKPEKRWQRGNGYLKHHQDNAISRAIRKYKWKNFKKEIVWEGFIENKEELNNLEKEFIIKYNTLAPDGYNLEEGGNCKKLSEKTKKKMSLSKIKLFEKKGSYRKPEPFICKRCGKLVISLDKNLARARKRFENGRCLCKICKTKETMLQRYGEEFSLRNSEILNKKKDTTLKRYNKLGFHNKEKIEETMLKKYGVKYYTEIINKKE